jgi:hypothetical protein
MYLQFAPTKQNDEIISAEVTLVQNKNQEKAGKGQL